MKKQFAILVLAVFLLVLLPGVSATDWDNVVTYTDNDLTVTIDNLFGLGAEIGEVTLKSHKTVDEVLKFGFGQEEVVMYYDFEG